MALLAAGDLAVVAIAYACAFALRIYVPIPLTTSLLPSETLALTHDALPIALATQVPLLWVFRLYDRRTLLRGSNLLLAPAAALGLQLLAISAWYFFRGDLVFPRSVLVLFTAFDAAGVAGLRLLAQWHLARSEPPARILLVGAPADTADFERALLDADPHRRRYHVVATRDPGAEAIDDAAGESGVDEVILVAAESWKDALLDRLLGDDPHGVRPRVAVVPTVYDLLVGRLTAVSVGDVPLIEVVKEHGDDLAWTVKAILDRVLALVLLVVTAPVAAAAMLAVAVSSPGPVLFRQQRVGRGGRPFTIYKLRTMRADAEAETGPTLAARADGRVTPVGRFLRATRIDEIPQLVNVLNGTMSLIGPRPERPEFAERHQQEIPGYRERWLVKPGLSGLAQVRGEYHTPAAYKLKYDLAYILNYSLLLDLRIMLATLRVLLTRRGV